MSKNVDIRISLERLHEGSSSGKLATDVAAAIGEKVHPFACVLYDIRTLLGEEPITYLEIGTNMCYTACLMLSHPYPTEVFCVNGSDPRTANTVQLNLARFATPSSPATLMTEPSDSELVISHLRASNVEVDLLFINGDPSYQGIRRDWVVYQQFLKPGGFVVFDNYNDEVYTPEARRAIDDVVKSLSDKEYLPIGCISNLQNLQVPPGIVYSHPGIGNDYVVYSLPRPVETEKIAVTIPTYKRRDGSAPQHIEKLFDCLSQQTFKDFTVYLVGDYYQDESEFESFGKDYHGQLVKTNSPLHARDHGLTSMQLWQCGGTHSIALGYKMAVDDGATLVLMMDDDDYWKPTHIQQIVEACRASSKPSAFTTKAFIEPSLVVPAFEGPEDSVVKWLPRACHQCRAASAYSSGLKHLLFWFWDEYIASIDAKTVNFPQDASLHNWLREHISRWPSLFDSYLINSNTVTKDYCV